MTTPHQSEASFMGEEVIQNPGFCGQAFHLSPHHPLLCLIFPLAPIYEWSECRKALCTGKLAMQATFFSTKHNGV